MALMKTGRKPNGEDPKKPKAQGEVKVTAKRSVEPPQKQYTWDDYYKNEGIKSRNKAAKQQYESDVESYNKAMKLYTKGPESPSNVGQKIGTGKLKGGVTATFEQGDYGTAESSNRMIEEKIKKGELVSMDDPSLDPTTRKLLKGVMLGGIREGESDIVGVQGKTYIPKGTKYTNYKEIYGEDFNPEEWQAAAKSGNIESYYKKSGLSSDRTFVPNVGFYQSYRKPEQSKAPAYEKELNIDRTKLPIEPLQKLPLKPVQKIDQGKGKLMTRSYEPTSYEKSDWKEPEGSIKYRTKYKTMRTQGGGNETLLGKAKNVGAFIKSKAEAIGKDNALSSGLVKTQGKARLIQGKSGREAKMAKAYFSGGYEGKSKFDIEGTSEERGAIGNLKADKADLKSGIKEARKAGDREKVQGYRAAKKDVKSDIKQAKLASKYLTRLGQETTGVREGQELRSTGKIKENTPAAYLGYTGSKQDTYNSDANFNKFLAKRSTDNPANRNTIPAQEKALSFKEKLASEKAERQKAPSFKEKRSIRAEEKKLQRSIKVPGE